VANANEIAHLNELINSPVLIPHPACYWKDQAVAHEDSLPSSVIPTDRSWQIVHQETVLSQAAHAAAAIRADSNAPHVEAAISQVASADANAPHVESAISQVACAEANAPHVEAAISQVAIGEFQGRYEFPEQPEFSPTVQSISSSSIGSQAYAEYEAPPFDVRELFCSDEDETAKAQWRN
jgi:hypothetical protein